MDEPAERIGHVERDQAVEALKSHHAQGRLDAQEYEDRSVRARQARTWDELTALFSDLPEPRPARGATPAGITPSGPAQSGTAQSGTAPSRSAPPGSAPSGSTSASNMSGLVHQGALLPEPWATRVMSLVPFAALILFFVTGSWLWFLAIPITGVIIYGSDRPHRGRSRDGRDRSRRDRDRGS